MLTCFLIKTHGGAAELRNRSHRKACLYSMVKKGIIHKFIKTLFILNISKAMIKYFLHLSIRGLCKGFNVLLTQDWIIQSCDSFAVHVRNIHYLRLFSSVTKRNLSNRFNVRFYPKTRSLHNGERLNIKRKK